jgi:adenylosuccinate synthase
VCIGYEVNGRRLKTFPTDVASLDRITPIYQSFEGWNRPLSGITAYTDLPSKARRYVEALAQLTGTQLWLVSVGPRRDQSIIVS